MVIVVRYVIEFMGSRREPKNPIKNESYINIKVYDKKRSTRRNEIWIYTQNK